MLTNLHMILSPDASTCIKKLLWTELHSPHYENTARSSDEIYSKHQTLSTQIGRPAVQAHKYLYGILKMHKATVGMRWIAGNHMQAIEGPPEHAGPKKMCTLCELPLRELLNERANMGTQNNYFVRKRPFSMRWNGGYGFKNSKKK